MEILLTVTTKCVDGEVLLNKIVDDCNSNGKLLTKNKVNADARENMVTSGG